MAKAKYYYYVGVPSENGLILVTNVIRETKCAEWDMDGIPKEFITKIEAENICDGLNRNMIRAFVVESMYIPITEQIFVVK